MEALYQQIATCLNEMIPNEWEKIYTYARINEDGGSVFFYFYPNNQETPIYSLDLPDKYHIDYDEFEKKFTELEDYFFELWDEYHKQGGEPWTYLTLQLRFDGKFNIDYKFDDLTDRDLIELQTIWEYEYLGLVPKEGSYQRVLFDKYFMNK